MVQILDTTLREGEQTPGVCFPPHGKLAIARALDRFGVSVIEGGHPSVTPSIEAAVRSLGAAGLKAQVAAHARSLQADVDLALDCGVDFLGIFYCVSAQRLDGVFRRSLSQAVDQICSVIRYAKERRPEVVIRYTPEDTVRSSFENVVEAAAAAVEAGADVISVADTTGHMVPGARSLGDYLLRLREALDAKGARPRLAVHCHNDRGLAVANALDAFRAGVDVIDATVLGLGERAGIVDLAQLAVVLTTDFGQEDWDLSALPELYSTVSTYSGVPIPHGFPVVGENAFTHCAGVHTHAATKNAVHYQSLDPALVGREMKVSLDHMSGLSSVQYALGRVGAEDAAEDPDLVAAVLAEVKRVGEVGRTVRRDELNDILAFCRARS
jgi:2-isopropylmalate synthase